MMILLCSFSAFIVGLMVLAQLRLRLREGNRQRALQELIRERVQSVN
jgi:hypothetical protein